MQIVSGFNHGTGGDNEKPLIKAANGLTMVMNKVAGSNGSPVYYGLRPDGGVVYEGEEVLVPTIAFYNEGPASDTPVFTVTVHGFTEPIDLRTSRYHCVLVTPREDVCGYISISPASGLSNEVSFLMIDGDNLTMAVGSFYLPSEDFIIDSPEFTIENFSSTYVFDLASVEA